MKTPPEPPKNQTVELEQQFRKEFDEFKLKPPKNSMPNLERELIIDFWRKAINRQTLALLDRLEEQLIGEDEPVSKPKYDSSDEVSRYIPIARNEFRQEQRQIIEAERKALEKS